MKIGPSQQQFKTFIKDVKAAIVGELALKKVEVKQNPGIAKAAVFASSLGSIAKMVLSSAGAAIKKSISDRSLSVSTKPDQQPRSLQRQNAIKVKSNHTEPQQAAPKPATRSKTPKSGSKTPPPVPPKPQGLNSGTKTPPPVPPKPQGLNSGTKTPPPVPPKPQGLNSGTKTPPPVPPKPSKAPQSAGKNTVDSGTQTSGMKRRDGMKKSADSPLKREGGIKKPPTGGSDKTDGTQQQSGLKRQDAVKGDQNRPNNTETDAEAAAFAFRQSLISNRFNQD